MSQLLPVLCPIAFKCTVLHTALILSASEAVSFLRRSPLGAKPGQLKRTEGLMCLNDRLKGRAVDYPNSLWELQYVKKRLR